MSPYKYSGVPLTPTPFAELILQLAPHEPFTRAELINLVVAHHETAGGLAARTSVEATAKKALQMLQADGHVSQVSYRYWRLSNPAVKDKSNNSIQPHETIELGVGSETVYVYYFPAYRDQAAYLDRDVWPMKIGRTAGELSPRIRDQVGTAMPEYPILGLTYRTNDSSNMEKVLHSTLTSRNRRVPEAPGKEWFMTSLKEVREILDFANGQP